MNGRHPLLILLAVALVIASCQQNNTPTAAPDRVLTPSVHIGEWMARLEPLNQSGVSARARVISTGEGGTFTVAIQALGLESNLVHAQHIHGFTDGSNGVCPTPEADVNGDGVIDVIEGLPDYGPILLSLDGDLTDGAEVDDLTTFPNPDNRRGQVRYEASASYEPVNAALDLSIPLENRHIVLHGVSGPVPSTAQGIGPFTAAQALPVACGVLERVS
ncbi:MAG: hypothetical protein ACREK3_00435 [Gemmatimonadota bacterium]